MINIVLDFVSIPESLENLQLPSPELLNYYTDLKERKIWIDGEIDDGLLEVSKHILRWNKEDQNIPIEQRKVIKLFIFSNGGSADATFNLVNICELSQTPIYTYNMGNALSAGLLILLAGHRRFCLHGSHALMHSGSGGSAGTYEQVESATDDYKWFIKYMHAFILRRTKIEQKTLNRYKSKDWYLYAEDQVKHGIVDAIITDISEIL